jgi:hypothetical protein
MNSAEKIQTRIAELELKNQLHYEMVTEKLTSFKTEGFVRAGIIKPLLRYILKEGMSLKFLSRF